MNRQTSQNTPRRGRRDAIARRRAPLPTTWLSLTACLALPALSGCGKTLAKVDTELGQTTTASVTLSPGAEVAFPVSASWVNYDEARYILLHVELMKNGKVVQTVDCRGYSFSRGSSGCGTGSTQTIEECRAVVKASGVDAMRVSTKVDVGEASVTGLTVSVKER